MVEEAADFRLMGKVAVKRSSLMAKPIFSCVASSLRSAIRALTVGYERKPRTAGVSKYPLKKMLALAWNGDYFFSVKPLDLLFSGGTFLAVNSILVMIVFAFLYGLNGSAVLGFHLFDRFAFPRVGIFLQGMGILGGYIGKINLEVKKRPRLFHRDDLG
jgi:hypothetical protein